MQWSLSLVPICLENDRQTECLNVNDLKRTDCMAKKNCFYIKSHEAVFPVISFTNDLYVMYARPRERKSSMLLLDRSLN